MKAAVIGVVLSAAALAQESDKKPVEVTTLKIAPTSGPCAIPLLNALPQQSTTGSRMPNVKPGGKPLSGDVTEVPAPACDEIASAKSGVQITVRPPAALNRSKVLPRDKAADPAPQPGPAPKQ